MGDRRIVCDLGGLEDADLRTLEALAWLRLAVRRRGWRLAVVAPPAALRELAELCGLAESLGLDPGREPEHREEAGGVKEEGDGTDPLA